MKIDYLTLFWYLIACVLLLEVWLFGTVELFVLTCVVVFSLIVRIPILVAWLSFTLLILALVGGVAVGVSSEVLDQLAKFIFYSLITAVTLMAQSHLLQHGFDLDMRDKSMVRKAVSGSKRKKKK